ncbi:DUF2062 domain-containing protein [Sinomicrobium weinanense]|uniref:DUF2062 domain-containing protein n=1 Tax=Sinomicrobium weinanense TaxID=2842200 RepID=A0A926JQR7_9FLAO|nr:DUF2062 domain-containing protein [Sinomicrobium weinanense]MBC9795631.1 DUF2062 domain-containing protein [Sinomicrobium weinanense]MBU3124652.1 DUF2062 domain-containing protein [Sinomicrobium weinanense]
MSRVLTILKTKIFALKGSPEQIAKGFAIGSFIGMMPVPGLQMFISLGIASCMKVNKKAACLAVFNTNLFTGTFIFTFNYWLGKTVLGLSSDFVFPDKIGTDLLHILWSSGKNVLYSLLAGGCITGIFCAWASYYVVLLWFRKKSRC